MVESSFHPYAGKKVFFATMHNKAEILRPLFLEIGVECVPALINTDTLGTFSGEVDRVGSVLETLRKKILMCSESFQEAEFIVASEGTFGLHPRLGFFQTGLESLLFWQRSNNTELYVEYLDLSPHIAEEVISTMDEAQVFLTKVNFPMNALMIFPENLLHPMFKGLTEHAQVSKAISECLIKSPDKRVVLRTDMRSCFNERRRLAIYQAGRELLKALNSFCPNCSQPGFIIRDSIPGLECNQCGAPTRLAEKVIFTCNACGIVEERLRPDGKEYADPGDCGLCNP